MSAGAGSPTPTVAAGAGALTALLTRDVEAGSIEQPAAQQIANELTGILNSYEMGHTMNLPHELASLTKQVTMLEEKGQISAAAAPPLLAALANLETAIAEAAPDIQTQNPQPPGHSPASPPATPAAVSRATPAAARGPRGGGLAGHTGGRGVGSAGGPGRG